MLALPGTAVVVVVVVVVVLVVLAIVSVSGALEAVIPLASVTVSTTCALVGAVGVPVIVPEAEIESPLGRPLADQLYGGAPPLAVTFWP
jgi:hypothetical protein